MRRFVWVLVLELCSCAIARDGTALLPAPGEAGKASAGTGGWAGGGDAARSGEGGTAAGGSEAGSGASSASGSGGRACKPGYCDATSLSLEAYCKLEHARCPVDMTQARAAACANSFAIMRQSYSNACGGESVRILHTFGSVELSFDGSGKLSAVNTLTNSKSGPCDASLYHYGAQGCTPAGKETEIPCE